MHRFYDSKLAELAKVAADLDASMMAGSATYFGTPNNGAVPMGTFSDTNLLTFSNAFTGTPHAGLLLTAGASGTKVNEIRFVLQNIESLSGEYYSVGAELYIISYDGTNKVLWDRVPVSPNQQSICTAFRFDGKSGTEHSPGGMTIIHWPPWVLETGESVYVSQSVTQAFFAKGLAGNA